MLLPRVCFKLLDDLADLMLPDALRFVDLLEVRTLAKRMASTSKGPSYPDEDTEGMARMTSTSEGPSCSVERGGPVRKCSFLTLHWPTVHV